MTIEELLKALGVEVNDENTQQVETLVAFETAGLKSNRDKFRAERDKARAQLKELDGFDAESVQEALGVEDLDLGELPDLIRAAKAVEKDPKQDARVIELEGKLERAKKSLTDAQQNADTLNATLKAKLATLAVEGAVTDALAKEDGNVKLLRPHLVGRVKTEVDDAGDVTMTILAANGDPMEDSRGGDASIKDLVKEFANSDDFAAAFKASGVGGSGADEGRGRRTTNNPWSKDSQNLTEQARIRRENPELAKRLQAEA